jgi:hypothetical protein
VWPPCKEHQPLCTAASMCAICAAANHAPGFMGPSRPSPPPNARTTYVSLQHESPPITLGPRKIKPPPPPPPPPPPAPAQLSLPLLCKQGGTDWCVCCYDPCQRQGCCQDGAAATGIPSHTNQPYRGGLCGWSITPQCVLQRYQAYECFRYHPDPYMDHPTSSTAHQLVPHLVPAADCSA